jgi:malate synthase
MDGKQPVNKEQEELKELSFKELAEKFEEIAKKLDEIVKKLKEVRQELVCEVNCCYRKQMFDGKNYVAITVCRFPFATNLSEDVIDFLLHLVMKYRTIAEKAWKNYKNLNTCSKYTEDYDIAVLDNPPVLASTDQIVYVFNESNYIRIFINDAGEIEEICKPDSFTDDYYYVEHHLSLAMSLVEDKEESANNYRRNKILR